MLNSHHLSPMLLLSGSIHVNQFEARDEFGVNPEVTGFDLVDDPAEIRKHFPFVTPEARFMKYVRCAGYLNVARLGEYLLKEFQTKGGKVIRGDATKVRTVENGDTKARPSVVSGLFCLIHDFGVPITERGGSGGCDSWRRGSSVAGKGCRLGCGTVPEQVLSRAVWI